jgi:hypothetical protein
MRTEELVSAEESNGLQRAPAVDVRFTVADIRSVVVVENVLAVGVDRQVDRGIRAGVLDQAG